MIAPARLPAHQNIQLLTRGNVRHTTDTETAVTQQSTSDSDDLATWQ